MAVVAHCEENTLINKGCVHEGKFSEKHGLNGIPSVCESVHIARDILLAEAKRLPLSRMSCKYERFGTCNP